MLREKFDALRAELARERDLRLLAESENQKLKDQLEAERIVVIQEVKKKLRVEGDDLQTILNNALRIDLERQSKLEDINAKNNHLIQLVKEEQKKIDEVEGEKRDIEKIAEERVQMEKKLKQKVVEKKEEVLEL